MTIADSHAQIARSQCLLLSQGDAHDREDSNHGEAIAAKLGCDNRNELDARLNVILNHHPQTKRRMMKQHDQQQDHGSLVASGVLIQAMKTP